MLKKWANPFYLSQLLVFQLFVIRTRSKIKANGFGPIEGRHLSAFDASFLFSIGLFLLGWAANGHLYWIAIVVSIGMPLASSLSCSG